VDISDSVWLTASKLSTFYQMVVSLIHATGKGKEMESGALREKRE
jgi:hypothetical protein